MASLTFLAPWQEWVRDEALGPFPSPRDSPEGMSDF